MHKLLRTACTAICVLLFPFASAQQDAEVIFNPTQVTEKIWLLQGQGGNIAAFVGSDGVLLVDDSFDRLSASLEAAVLELGGEMPHFVLNTHFHGDHTGGNAALGREGHIVAHANTRTRLIEGYDVAGDALPAITYTDEADVYFNDEQVRVIHMPAGHTDGDSVVWFVDSNVVHMGDLFFSGRFPFIDLNNGGSFEGALANLKSALAMLPEAIQVIPGHGPLSSVQDISRTIEMFEATGAEVREGLAAGMDVDQLVKQGLSSPWDEWGWQFINEERWIRTIVASYSDE